MKMERINSYPKVYNIGHKAIRSIFEEPVWIEEKFDGSQASFGVIDGELKFKSKNKLWNIHGPCEMFQEGVEYLKSIKDRLHEGWIYRAEYFQESQQNSIEYDRIPKNHFKLFDVMIGLEDYMRPESGAETTDLYDIAEKLEIGKPNILDYRKVESVEELESALEMESALGGAKMEGVVVKNYGRFGKDKKPLMGKLVRDDFKEKNKKNWQKQTKKSLMQRLIEELKTKARWKKSIQHRRERGELLEAPQDIGPLIEEIQEDVKEEEEEYIKEKLFKDAWPDIKRAITGGFPEWYKEEFLSEK